MDHLPRPNSLIYRLYLKHRPIGLQYKLHVEKLTYNSIMEQDTQAAHNNPYMHAHKGVLDILRSWVP